MNQRAATSAIPTVVGLARALRAAGVPASLERVHAFTRALDALEATRREDVYWAGRLTLCSHPEDLPRYDRVFTAFFAGRRPVEREPRREVTVVRSCPGDGEHGAEGEQGDAPADAARASRVEALRHKDIAELDARERAELARLLAALTLPGERRRTRRWRSARRGVVDRRATVRKLLRHGGEPIDLRHRRHRHRPRRVVLLVDVSGSMAPYADALLRFAHAATVALRRAEHPTPEVFTVGTRLTHVSRELSLRDPDAALRAVADAVPDWEGGTRLGELAKEFLDRWGQRGLARGAVVVVCSDGWERDDPSLLGAQMARLSRLAHRVVWSNPRKARPGYEPLAGGMAAALPHVDDFVSGHSLAALEQLARVVAGSAAGRRNGPGTTEAGAPALAQQ